MYNETVEQRQKKFFYDVAPTKKFGRDISLLTYSSRSPLKIGDLIEIPLGKSASAGVVMRAAAAPDFECREILRKVFDRGLPLAQIELARFMAEFYASDFATLWSTFLPGNILKNHRVTEANVEQKMCSIRETLREKVLTNSQKSALETLEKMPRGTAILRGITGSGKTEVYKRLAKTAIAAGKNVIILVPEISLTAQLVDDFREFFAGSSATILATDSSKTPAQRFKSWDFARKSSEPIVAIGPRSALFLPLDNIGLIIVDEEHEPSYAQEQAPRYNAKTVAAKLAEIHGAKLILGSATPLVADVFTAQKLGRPVVEMPELAKIDAAPAKISIVDMRERANFSSESPIFSRKLIAKIHAALNENRQVLLFHNRRGTAATTLCENCGWTALCPNCFLPMTLHADAFELRCHICNFRAKVPTSCPECGHADIIFRGIGTKRIEDEARKLFGDATNVRENPAAIRRFDGDTKASETVAKLYRELRSGETKIIIGTQQIAKGLDLPKLALVGVIQADAGLNLPDFGARERTFELVTQAIGRVGRHNGASEAVIQTYQPDAAAIKYAASQDFAGFYADEIEERARGHFPPFAHLWKISCTFKTERAAVENSRKIAQYIRAKRIQNVFVLGPSPSFYERARGNFSWQVVVRAPSRALLAQLNDEIMRGKSLKNWTSELDPGSLI